VPRRKQVQEFDAAAELEELVSYKGVEPNLPWFKQALPVATFRYEHQMKTM